MADQTNPFAAVVPPPDGRSFRWSVGARSIDPADWLVVDQNRHRELAKKDQLLLSQPEQVLATLADGDDASAELLELICSNLAHEHPAVFRISDELVLDKESGRVTFRDERHPVAISARLVAEDLCVMTRQRDRWHLSAASVCFPSRWALADKIGRDLSGIHEPVPGYEQRLGGATQQLFDRLEPDRPVVRANWTLLPTPELHLPASVARQGPGSAVGALDQQSSVDPPEFANAGAQLWVRVERQTVRCLPQSRGAAFTIHTSVSPLADLSPKARRDLAATLATVPTDVAQYKGWERILAAAIAWCRE